MICKHFFIKKVGPVSESDGEIICIELIPKNKMSVEEFCNIISNLKIYLSKRAICISLYLVPNNDKNMVF